MTSKTKIIFLCFNLSSNCLGRVYILAKALQRYYEVEIIGPANSGKIWGPVSSDKTVKLKIVPQTKLVRAVKESNPDLIYACKPKPTSYGVGLLIRKMTGKPLILDIDDWELGFYPLRGKLYSSLFFWDMDNYVSALLMDKLIPRVKYKTVSNTFLKKKFGGTLVPHFRDTNLFDPKDYNQKNIKKELGLENQKIILFLGTPRKHKGVLDLIAAVEKLARHDVTLLIVGANKADKAGLPTKPFLKVLGQQPFNEIPKFLAASDIVTIFQAASKASLGQLPAKVFDAMSMAKPVIASRVSDLPNVLKDCGVIVTPGDIDELVRKMALLLDNPELAKELGKKARDKCIQEYSYDAMAPKLHELVEEVLDKARQTART